MSLCPNLSALWNEGWMWSLLTTSTWVEDQDLFPLTSPTASSLASLLPLTPHSPISTQQPQRSFQSIRPATHLLKALQWLPITIRMIRIFYFGLTNPHYFDLVYRPSLFLNLSSPTFSVVQPYWPLCSALNKTGSFLFPHWLFPLSRKLSPPDFARPASHFSQVCAQTSLLHRGFPDPSPHWTATL